MQSFQYTLRGISQSIDQALRAKARREGKSLNEVTLESLSRGLGVGIEPMPFHDLDHLAGTWREDPRFDQAIKAQDQIDPDLWK